LAAALDRQGIATGIYYPRPLPDQPALARLGSPRVAAVPQAQAACRSVLSLPLYPELPDEAISRVVQCVTRTLLPR
jgi:dTDP-4-amino-4,6-dideoxygalactose transaminase